MNMLSLASSLLLVNTYKSGQVVAYGYLKSTMSLKVTYISSNSHISIDYIN